jgi:hypothetical protein
LLSPSGYDALSDRVDAMRGEAAAIGADGWSIEPFGGKVLACVNGSEWLQGLPYLLSPAPDLVILLYVSPRSDPGYEECGKMVLEVAQHRCRLYSRELSLQCRLVVGEVSERILAVCGEEQPDVLVLGARLLSSPAGSVEGLAALAGAVWANRACPIILGSSHGVELLAGDRRLWVRSRSSRSDPSTSFPATPVAPARPMPVTPPAAMISRPTEKPKMPPKRGSPIAAGATPASPVRVSACVRRAP